MESHIAKLYSLMGLWALLQTLLPPPLRQWLERRVAMAWEKLFQTGNSHVEVQVEERPGRNHSLNIFYREVGVYLTSLRSSLDSHTRLKACRSVENGGLFFSLPDNETLQDCFKGACIWWTHSTTEKEGDNGVSVAHERKFTLRFLKCERNVIISAYLDHVSAVAAEIERKGTQRCLHTNRYGEWEETPFNHPSTFDTLALDDGLADRIKADLDAFCKAESFYHKNGRVWKRGYLLYGPPGTGKSSMIAAIANHVEFDIYDLELTKVTDNAELKSLLMQTTRKSVIVIEDIDCASAVSDRGNSESTSEEVAGSTTTDSATNNGSKLTLSGLLNFTDGLWSCCGEERIFIFTTNHKDKLDPALLRAGRMDMHILLSYCTFPAFKKLASNYLEIQDHPLYPNIKDAMTGQSHQLTPAALSEMLISNQSDADVALRQVMAALPCSPFIYSVDTKASANSLGKTNIEKSGIRARVSLFFMTVKRLKREEKILSAFTKPPSSPIGLDR